MKLLLEITLSEEWDSYKEVVPELILEDIFRVDDPFKRGVNAEIIYIDDYQPVIDWWNNMADEYNQWQDLSQKEKIDAFKEYLKTIKKSKQWKQK